jgi:hypothetical protein
MMLSVGVDKGWGLAAAVSSLTFHKILTSI